MASVYSCAECNRNLNLQTINLFPSDFYFEAGNKGTLSFAVVDESKLKLEKEDKIRPFFETVNYWGIQRKRIKMKCNNCRYLLGYVYDDGPPLTNSTGQFHMGPSQVIPRDPRFRFKTKALKITTET
ncbi:hypothetical protein C5167_010494 [Papaver somniferum]|uniref:Uncharacterized protein n=1 Tax=Papaver somniferum TaxID=3469 RepID=A0A4Y7K0E1_PAPSO|nr:uncharacterized protein LOC113286094 [Papaver somniferum]RZC66803.1 hypothetical protein C5167_010494 [Papaver somniferum]